MKRVLFTSRAAKFTSRLSEAVRSEEKDEEKVMHSKTAGSLPPHQNWGSGKMGPRVTCPITCGFSGATSRDGVHFVYLGVGEPRKGKAEEATLPTGGCRIKTNKKTPFFFGFGIIFLRGF
ncbi:hypothetical protein CDAR_6041 [Caerostris darwini]|uniref:Uncharacterized protein n=1 Tax=Caerostris darwini TaxID=1538125 RepID=A0AAV4S9H6_9ARAC|nr:hypothetical protein CDAR_6041 [Caerostris darwini]